MSIPNHLDVVQAARTYYAAYAGPQRAYLIVNKVAWDLRAEGAGMFFKDSGTAYLQRSLDIVIYKPAGETFDILGSAETDAVPQWNRTAPTGFGDVARWRQAVDPATIEHPDPPDDLTARVEALEADSKKQAEQIRILGDQMGLLQSDILSLTERVTALEAHPATPCTVQDVQTSRSFGHTHKVKVCLP